MPCTYIMNCEVPCKYKVIKGKILAETSCLSSVCIFLTPMNFLSSSLAAEWNIQIIRWIEDKEHFPSNLLTYCCRVMLC